MSKYFWSLKSVRQQWSGKNVRYWVGRLVAVQLLNHRTIARHVTARLREPRYWQPIRRLLQHKRHHSHHTWVSAAGGNPKANTHPTLAVCGISLGTPVTCSCSSRTGRVEGSLGESHLHILHRAECLGPLYWPAWGLCVGARTVALNHRTGPSRVLACNASGKLRCHQ
jgi:hypothetical protein